MSVNPSATACLFLATLMAAHPAVQAGEARLGSASGVFLRLARTAREAALGGCGVDSDGPAALAENPAAIGAGEGVIASRNEVGAQEISVDYVALSRRVRRKFGVGLSVIHGSGGAINQTDDAGQSVGSFTPRDFAATMGFSRPFGPFAAGVTASYLYSRIIHVAHAVTTGAGVEWTSDGGGTRAGLYAANLTGRLRYVDAAAPLPRSVHLGLRRRLGRHSVMVEGVAPRDDDPYPAAGLEFNFGKDPWAFALRTGYQGAQARSREGAPGLSLGAGLAAAGWSLDYAWTPGGDFGDDHLLTLGIRFKPSDASAPREPRRPPER